VGNFTTRQLTDLMGYFAQTGAGNIPGSWVADGGITAAKIDPTLVTNWNAAYAYGPHAGLYATIAQGVKADTAFGWGDPAGVYAPIAQGIAGAAAYSWGNHASQSYMSLAEFLQVRGATADTLVLSAWTTRAIAETANTLSGASVATNQITLPAGTYYVEGWAQAKGNAGTTLHQLRLRDFADTTTYLLGGSMTAANGLDTTAHIAGRMVLAAGVALVLGHWAGTTAGVGGTASGSAEDDIFVDLRIWRVA
jgi:hypothetical protein